VHQKEILESLIGTTHTLIRVGTVHINNLKTFETCFLGTAGLDC